MKRHRLELLGITYNQIESGVYAVILRQVGGTIRIPIIIGYPEAQAIECKLQEVVTPRPLTHDMIMNLLEDFGITLKEIEIRHLPSGVFAADLIFTDGTNTHIIDSRSSDAIALAIRANAPIYTSEEVLAEAGFDPDEQHAADESSSVTQSNNPITEVDRNPGKSIEELRSLMQQAAEQENYEEAARIKAQIDSLIQNTDEENSETV